MGLNSKYDPKEPSIADYRSVDNLRVYCEDEHVGDLRRTPKGCVFQYTDAFLNSDQRPIALHLPKDPNGLIVEGIANLPTYFAGLLPEGVMLSAIRNLVGSAPDDLFAILAATGSDAIGDIDVRIPGETAHSKPLDLEQAVHLIEALLHRRINTLGDQITAIPGVQPKLSIGSIVRSGRKTTYIAKFESPDFPNLLRNEFECMRLAKRCRLNVADVETRQRALIIHRFDRKVIGPAKKIVKAHVEDLCQAMDLFPNAKYSMEYRDLMVAMQRLGTSKATLLDALRLYVFSYIIGNGDMHAKNISMILDRETGQWRLSPAYDLLSTLPYCEVLPGADRMALALAGGSFGRFTVAEFVAFGAEFELTEVAVVRMLKAVSQAVLSHVQNVVCGVLTAKVVETMMLRAESLRP